MDDEKRRELSARYQRAAHAMQSGVAFKMQLDGHEVEPKHLRTGINAAMVEHSALAKLLIAKGIVSEEEYMTVIAEAMEEEVERYRRALSELVGGDVNLA